MTNILALEIGEERSDALDDLMCRSGGTFRFESVLENAFQQLSEGGIDLVFIDLDFIEESLEEIIERVKTISPFTQIVLITNSPNVRDSVQAIKSGALDYLSKPLDKEQIRKAVIDVDQEKISRKLLDQESLRHDKARFQDHLNLIIENMLCGVAVLEGPEFKYLGVNQFLADLNGLPIEEHLGRPLIEVLPESAVHILPQMKQVVESGEPVHGREFSLCLPKNPDEPVHLLDHLYPTTGADGKPNGVIAVVIDVTELKRAESDRAELEARLHANSELLSRVSHEFRTPLNSILGHTQILQMEKDTISKSQSESIDDVMVAGNHLLSLINTMLDLSKSEVHELDLEIAHVPLSELLSHCRAIIEPLATSANVLLSPMPETSAVVLADRQRLSQVLINLLSNAVKYNKPEGRVTVNVDDSEESIVRIEVKDTGCGFSDEHAQMIFEPFQRLANSSMNIGTGLGLAIAKSLIHEMGGRIGATSAVGKGSTFWIEIPRAS